MIRTYLIALVSFLLIDMIWLAVVARQFYQSQIGFLMKPDVNWIAASIFYLIFVAGLVFFVIQPALAAGSLRQGLLTAAFYGLITYATYDLTNLAVVKSWPLLLTVVDIAWGVMLASLVTVCTYYFVR